MCLVNGDGIGLGPKNVEILKIFISQGGSGVIRIRQIDPPAAKFMTNSIKLTKRLSEIKMMKNCKFSHIFSVNARHHITSSVPLIIRIIYLLLAHISSEVKTGDFLIWSEHLNPSEVWTEITLN